MSLVILLVGILFIGFGVVGLIATLTWHTQFDEDL